MKVFLIVILVIVLIALGYLGWQYFQSKGWQETKQTCQQKCQSLGFKQGFCVTSGTYNTIDLVRKEACERKGATSVGNASNCTVKKGYVGIVAACCCK